MTMDTDRLRALVANIVFFGDFQELMNLYGAQDVSLSPESLAEMYAGYDLAPEVREAVEEIAAAIADDLVPSLDGPVTAPAEMVELLVQCAIEHGKYHVALKALREVGGLDQAYQRYAEHAAESLAAGDHDRAAWELIVAGRLGWARSSPGQRAEFLVSLGIDAIELALALGAESSRGRASGGRPLPEFPAWQTYGPLFHARCGLEECMAQRSVAQKVPIAVRYLVHDDAVAQRALDAVGEDALPLLKALAAESDRQLGEFAERYRQADERYRELRERWSKGGKAAAEEAEPSAEAPDTAGEAVPGEADEPPPDAEAEGPSEDRQPEGSTLEAVRAGLEGVQELLLGRAEKQWRNCLAQLANDHPLSVFTVCTVRGPDIDGYVAPVGDPGSEFLRAMLD